jgi:hypothetical protein
MSEKMHLFGLLSPIFHPRKVKEVKDTSVRESYISLLLSLLSPPPPCAPRSGMFFLRICARRGERGKEVPIDTHATPPRSSRHVCARSNISCEVGRCCDHAQGANVAQMSNGARWARFNGSSAGSRRGRSRRERHGRFFLFVVIANVALFEGETSWK